MLQFSEQVTYYADGTGGGRTINAMIEREVQLVSELGDVNGLATVISVLNNATTGISSTEINTEADEITVAMRIGETPQRRQIVRVESTENGIVRFVVN